MNRPKSALTVLLAAGMLLSIGRGIASGAPPSINSTSQNSAALPVGPVARQPFVNLDAFRIIAFNDLGMHCGDLDHRVVSILPPFNVLHAQVIQKATPQAVFPTILTDFLAGVYYSAAPNPKDPSLQKSPTEPVYKTNFWDINPRTGRPIVYDAYSSFYPPRLLGRFRLDPDIGLPVPDVWRLYLGDKKLVASQQPMPSVSSLNPVASSPYTLNAPQVFRRFDAVLPFFISFPFGYVLPDPNWFSADGIPVAPYDDFGRENPYPLMRVQAKDSKGFLTGVKGRTLATVDTVVPIAAEADCFRCHTSSADGGNGQAACMPGLDANCPQQGSPSNRSGVAFSVATAAQDTENTPPKVKREWAADWNIIRLHDAKHNTTLAKWTPVVCQRCHYSPALDLAQLGPIGPSDVGSNGKQQRRHRSNSRVMHAFHGKLDLFKVRMPSPNDPRRMDPKTGKPVVTNAVNNILNQTCYQCHPGRDTHCLRGVMYNTGGLVCQDCHGGMLQVGDDFSFGFPRNPFPAGADLTKRVPWATEPACQSCHTGDVLTTLAKTDPNVIASQDGIRLLQAYRVGDSTAKPIEAPTSRFAENTINGNRVLYRLSTERMMRLACETCHGSTHAEWPVKPAEGAVIANDNQTSLQVQGYPGKILECTVCHGNSTLPARLDGPHGIHPINAANWINGGHKQFLSTNPLDSCRACHGLTGEGTVLSKTPIDRTLAFGAGSTVNVVKLQLVSCSLCHANPL